jgi:hypothetical protein
MHAKYKATVNDDFAHYPFLDESLTMCQEAGFNLNKHPNPTHATGCNLRRHIDIRHWHGDNDYRTDSEAQTGKDGLLLPDPVAPKSPPERKFSPMDWWLKRQTAFEAFLPLATINARKNLRIMPSHRVERLLFDESGGGGGGGSGRPSVIGVRTKHMKSGKFSSWYASKDTVLSAGVFNSPQV